jgi:hypothetical protein
MVCCLAYAGERLFIVAVFETAQAVPLTMDNPKSKGSSA